MPHGVSARCKVPQLGVHLQYSEEGLAAARASRPRRRFGLPHSPCRCCPRALGLQPFHTQLLRPSRAAAPVLQALLRHPQRQRLGSVPTTGFRSHWAERAKYHHGALRDRRARHMAAAPATLRAAAAPASPALTKIIRFLRWLSRTRTAMEGAAAAAGFNWASAHKAHAGAPGAWMMRHSFRSPLRFRRRLEEDGANGQRRRRR